MHHNETVTRAAWSWVISVTAVGLFVWGVAELIGVGGTTSPAAGVILPATELGRGLEAAPIIALHRLLPDATDDLGRRVRIDGSVVGAATIAGFWVRDLRDNIVFVGGRGEERATWPPVRAGDAVRVVGVVALLSPSEQARRLERAGLVIPERAIVVRDIKVVASPEGVEVLQD